MYPSPSYHLFLHTQQPSPTSFILTFSRKSQPRLVSQAMATESSSSLSSTLLLLSALLTFSGSWLRTRSDDPCPYPCNPPPTGAGGIPATPTPPTQTGSSYPPPTYYSFPPPQAGYNPYNQPPTGGGLYVPPPPDPILPYFPFYYKEPLHGSSAASTVRASTAVTVMITSVLVFLVTCNFYLS